MPAKSDTDELERTTRADPSIVGLRANIEQLGYPTRYCCSAKDLDKFRDVSFKISNSDSHIFPCSELNHVNYAISLLNGRGNDQKHTAR
jgi:hypothetical protein